MIKNIVSVVTICMLVVSVAFGCNNCRRGQAAALSAALDAVVTAHADVESKHEAVKAA